MRSVSSSQLQVELRRLGNQLPMPGKSNLLCEVFQFNSIQNSLFSTQHIVHTTMCFYTYDVSKMERAEDSAYVGSFPNIII